MNIRLKVQGTTISISEKEWNEIGAAMQIRLAKALEALKNNKHKEENQHGKER